METNADGLRKAAKRVFWEARRIESEQDAYAASSLRWLADVARTNGVSDRMRSGLAPMSEGEWNKFCLGMKMAAAMMDRKAKEHEENAGVTVPSERQTDRIP